MQEVSNLARYDRQNLIEGWNQERIQKARVGVIGADILGQMTAVSLAALGFGHIEIYDIGNVDPKQAGIGSRSSRISKTRSLESMLKNINPSSDIRGIDVQFSHASQASLLSSLDVVVDCTNDSYSKLIALEWGRESKKPVVTAASSSVLGELGVSAGNFDESYLFADYQGKDQSILTAMVIGGLAADEVRKLVMPLNDKPLDRIVSYNRHSKQRTGYAEDIEINPKKHISDMHVVIIGAGALGNFVGMGLAIKGVGKMTVFDDDEVEETNLNRQVLFYDSVGRHKAEALVEKLVKINPKIEYEYFNRRVGKSFGKFLRDENPALVIDCVDNFKTRALLNYYARIRGVPLIGGGTDFKSGQAAVYVPGKTSCFQCQLAIDDLALKSFRPQSCIYAPEPSVVISNQVVGGFIVGEVGCVLSPHIHGEPIQGILKYNSLEPQRIGMLGSRGACDCHSKSKDFYRTWMKKMNKLYEKGA